MAVDQKLDSSLGGLERRLDGIRDEVGTQIGDQLQNFMVMFTRQNYISLSPDFLPRERTELVLTSPGVRNEHAGPAKIEVVSREGDTEVDQRREGPIAFNQLGFLVPKLEIPLFDRSNPRWWVRRCE